MANVPLIQFLPTSELTFLIASVNRDTSIERFKVQIPMI